MFGDVHLVLCLLLGPSSEVSLVCLAQALSSGVTGVGSRPLGVTVVVRSVFVEMSVVCLAQALS